MKPGVIASILLSVMFISLTVVFVYYGIFDRQPPLQNVTAEVVLIDRSHERMEIAFTAKHPRYCGGERYQFLRDHLNLSMDPEPIPPQGFRGPKAMDGALAKWVISVHVPDYFWQEKDGFSYHPEWHFRCNSLQGSLLPEIIVVGPNVHVDFHS